MCTISENTIKRVTDIKSSIESNIRNNTRIPMHMSDILFIKALSGGKLRIDNRCTNSPVLYEKLQKLGEDLRAMGNVIFSTSDSANCSNLLIGDLVDAELYSGLYEPVHTTVLRNIDLLIIPDREIYRYMKNTQFSKGSVCQKLLELDSDDIVDTVFKFNSFKTRFGGKPTAVRCTDDLIRLTNEGDFIVLLSDDLAFMAAAAKTEAGETEEHFYLINGSRNAPEKIKRLDDYSILSLYISTPELSAE
ncbi:MAG: hypothetical protein LUD77_00135 [Clostridiales bacterium]|nr:hypothetical protein [Clostridiales bacterium]